MNTTKNIMSNRTFSIGELRENFVQKSLRIEVPESLGDRNVVVSVEEK